LKKTGNGRTTSLKTSPRSPFGLHQGVAQTSSKPRAMQPFGRPQNTSPDPNGSERAPVIPLFPADCRALWDLFVHTHTAPMQATVSCPALRSIPVCLQSQGGSLSAGPASHREGGGVWMGC
uniref:Uncharacterized protein n=1 Tax=Gallus gallus TaxID=9031 RepID=A0A8V0YBX2_CHICK